jgi:hypothetical protein
MNMRVRMEGDVNRKDLDKWFRSIVLGLYRDVIIGTPVDTGRARANWQLAVGSAPASVLNKTDRGRSKSNSGASASEVRKANQKMGVRKAGRSVFIANNLGYIGVLEEGHSKQSSGWVENAMKRAKERVVTLGKL